MIPFFEFFMYLMIGITAGFLSGLLGVGGGLVVVPALLLVFHLLKFFPGNLMQTAVGTALAAMIFTSGASAWAHRLGVNGGLFKSLTPGLLLGSVLGAFIAHLLPTKQLQFIFGVFVFLFGTYLLLTANFKDIEADLHPSTLIMSIIGIFIGGLSSILGIGGGIITVPVLALFGTSFQHAISTSAATGFLIAVVGTLSFLFFGLKGGNEHELGYIYMPAFLIIGVSAAFIAPIGAKYAYSTPTIILKRLFGIYQIVIGVLLIWF